MTPLEELLDTLDRAAQPDDPPFLVAAFGAPGDDGVLVTDDDLSHLLGWQVPPECWAVGLVGGGRRLSFEPLDFAGRIRPEPPTDLESLLDEDGARMRLCCLVGRDGAVASLLRSSAGAVVASGDAEGRVIDALRRTLGLPTPPPERDTAELLAVLWIDNLLAAADAGASLGWPDAAALHPAMRVLAAEGQDIDVEHVTMIARVATAAWSWENLRIQSLQENWLSDLVPAPLAEWMDEGMFSRWLLADLPPVPSAASPVGKVFGPHVWREVQAVMAATGVGSNYAVTGRDGGCRRRATPEPGHPPPAMPRN
jgi:hypothetical protein